MNTSKIEDNKIKYSECDCEFTINGTSIEFCADLHRKHTINFNCKATFDILGKGLTQGVFQLQSPLGVQWCSKLKPENIDQISALGAILRPGCMECLSGDVKVSIKQYNRSNRNLNTTKIKIKDLYEKFRRNHYNYDNHIVSYNEETQELIDNKIIDVYYKGKQDIYKVNIKIRRFGQENVKFYKLKCTLHHRLLVHNKGWVQVKDINVGDRVAVISNLERPKEAKKYIKGERSFGNICFYNYEYRCVLCDWKEASLDVNHLIGNRKTNNDINNLCFLCPNHHRMFHENKITVENIIKERGKYKLKNTRYIYWAEFNGTEFIENNNVYDIEVESPYNNFIAGNFIVHNSKDEKGISTTIHYERRKNKKEEISSFHPIIDKILEKTYGCMLFQEQSMEIAKQCAGFSLQEADILRRGIGHKEPETIAKCKKLFLEKCKETKILTDKQAEEIFGLIEASQRYQFNESHSLSYALTAYVTAYIKCHFPLQFYRSWLSNEEIREEYSKFINEAKIFGIAVYSPDIRDFRTDFYIKKENIYFGLHNIKGLVKKDLDSLSRNFAEKDWSFDQIGKKISWMDFLSEGLECVSSKTAEVLIHSGALDCFSLSRARMYYEFERWNRLTPVEKSVYGGRSYQKELRDIIFTLVETEETDDSMKVLKYKEKLEKRKNSTRSYKTVLEEPKESRRLPKLREILNELTSPLYNIQDTVDSIIFAEENLLGVALTKHKTDEVVNAAETASCMDILKGKKGYNVLRTKIEECRLWKCKDGRTMAFIKLSDKSGQLPAIAFGEAYTEYQHLLTRGNLIFVSGEMGQKDSFLIRRVYNVS